MNFVEIKKNQIWKKTAVSNFDIPFEHIFDRKFETSQQVRGLSTKKNSPISYHKNNLIFSYILLQQKIARPQAEY